MRILRLSAAFAFLCAACSSTVLPDDGAGGSGGNGTADDGGNGTGNHSAQGGFTTGPSPSGGASMGGNSGTSSGGASPVGPGPTTGTTTDHMTTDSMDTSVVTTGTSSTGTGMMICDSLGGGCTSCVSTTCPEAWCACSDNPECIAMLVCFSQCTTDQCYQDCETQHSAGAGDAFNALGCPGCSGQCGAQPTDPCTECLYTTCEDTLNTCVGIPDCLSLWTCLNGCPPGGLSCQSNCYDTYPDGIDPLEALFNCATDDCPACN